MEAELVTNFSVNKPFDEAYSQGVETSLVDDASVKWKVLLPSKTL